MSHCPETVIIDGETCERFSRFNDSYCGGTVRFDVCMYRCPDKKLHVKAELQICGVAVGEEEYTVDTGTPPPTGARCAKQITEGEAQCELVDDYELSWLGGLVRVHVCAYLCADGAFTVGTWETFIFGRSQGRRRGTWFPWPI